MGHPPPELDTIRSLVETDLDRRIAAYDMPENLREAVRYGVLGGGKRLRPALVVLACEAAGGSRDAAMAGAAALELVHCFSLVHDDLPAMDDDDLRRGRPTLHRHTTEAMAILAGDVMLSLAFEVLADAPDQAAELAAATRGMINGQVLDTLGGFEPDLGDAAKLDLVHRQKTGALIVAGCRLGARSAGADQQTIDRLGRYGESIGLMFQIVDDVLDVTQTSEHLGKTAGKDDAAGKITWPGVHGLDACRRRIESLRIEAREALDAFGGPGEPLARLADFLAARTR